ncbi:hypothetical protein BD779DRAFT_934082 [Infundibulicybe gibba]|nr:hypothetical protein BD779DRAFT_1685397 [Infundibulicybe gibba]KAF8868557.1 hypothetical protein BD779DRAFT_934082 [Infundibulicybe gibba]
MLNEKAPPLPRAASYAVKSEDQPPSARIWRSGQPPHHKLPESGNHWKECKDRADQFDKDLWVEWNSEIDSLPTFAGLFSAVVTAFTIESYKWLQPNPQDMSNQILLNISAQLGNHNITTSAPPPFSPSASSIRINIVWFLSLSLSLGVGLFGIVCKQWLRRYKRDVSLPYEKDLALHQFQYEGFMRWGPVDILRALPPLLELGVLFFFIGLVDFLQSLNVEAAIPVVIIMGAGIALCFVATTAPAFQYLAYLARRRLAKWQYVHPPMFAFRSPQSSAILRFAAWLFSARDLDWTSRDIHFISDPTTLATYTARGLTWLDAWFAHSMDVVHQICKCMHDVTLPVLHQLAEDLLAVRKYTHKRDGKSYRADTAHFEEYAQQVLLMPDVAEEVVRDIVTGVYLDHRLHLDHHRDDGFVVERRVRVLHASHLPVSPELFYSVFEGHVMCSELRWQKAMLLRTLLVQKRIHALGVVATEAFDVCAHHNAFSDDDLESFFEAVRTWTESGTEYHENVAQKFVGCADGALDSERDSVAQFMQFLVK